MSRRANAEAPTDAAAVKQTANSAIVSKCSCVQLGYFDDPYAQYFVKPTEATRRSPLINRGYYARVAAVRHVMDGALGLPVEASTAADPRLDSVPNPLKPETKTPLPPGLDVPATGANASGPTMTERTAPRVTQIISLGAGYDTNYFRLKAQGGAPTHMYVEVDFASTCRRKHAIMQRAPALAELLVPLPGSKPSKPASLSRKLPKLSSLSESAPLPDFNPDEFAQPLAAATTTMRPDTEFLERYSGYALVGCDMADTATLERLLVEAGVDFTQPTLLLAECVLVYMSPAESQAVLAWAARKFGGGGDSSGSSSGGGSGGGAVFLTYEQIRPDDPFGAMMVRNIRAQGCPLLSLESHPSLDAHRARFRDCGWTSAVAFDMNYIYDNCVPRGDRRRVERLEMFDELEEWLILMAHYSMTMAYVAPAEAPSTTTTTAEEKVKTADQDASVASSLATIGFLTHTHVPDTVAGGADVDVAEK